MARNWYIIMALCVALSSTVHSAKFLGIFPVPVRSHNTVLTALTRELARRGHHVTVISSFPEQPPVPNITDIEIPIVTSEGCKFSVTGGLL
jgi:glucuronosyltransferase